MLKKAVGIADKAVNIFVLIVCIILFLMCLYAGFDTWMIYSHASDNSIQQYEPADGSTEKMKKRFPDAVAWLTIKGTDINYPVMQAADNDKYLNTDPYGDYSLSGSIFLDFRNKPDFSDKYSIIYGHHMEYHKMFGELDKYLDEKWFEKHRKGKLTTKDGTVYNVTIFASVSTTAEAAAVYDPSRWTELPDYIKKNAEVYKEPGSGSMIGLSTCAGDINSTDRLVVFGTLEGADLKK